MIDPLDVEINNGYSKPSQDPLSPDLGLRRAKLAKIIGQDRYFAYNPYPTDLTIQGIPAGLSIEIFDPKTGKTYPGGTTSGQTHFSKPTQFQEDYLLYIERPR